MGKTTIGEQIELLQYVEKEGQADLLGLSPDSLTRQNDYESAQRGLEESVKTGKSVLNGLPVVNHGVSGIRRLVEAVNCPIQPRYGAADARLCDEILLAGGCSNSAPDLLWISGSIPPGCLWKSCPHSSVCMSLDGLLYGTGYPYL